MRAQIVGIDPDPQASSTSSLPIPDVPSHSSADVDSGSREAVDLVQAADDIFADCAFAIGQAVGMRTTIDFDAMVWLRNRYREKFIRAMQRFGNRWQTDRHDVTGVGFMLGERAVRYTQGPSIDLDAIQKASADIERFCQLHSKRRARARGLETFESDQPLIAGYWCTL